MMNMNQFILEQLPGYVAWKDKELKYLGANKNLLKGMNFKHLEDLIGRDDKELALNTPESNEMFYQQDLLVLQGESLEIIHGDSQKGLQGGKTYFLQKSPLYSSSGELLGLIYSCSAWPDEKLLDLLKKIDQRYQPAESLSDYYALSTNHNPAKLSERELECLFLQLRGKTAREISQILNLSKRTIEYYIDNVKSKLGCLNKAELIIAAMQAGYHKYIPKRLVNINMLELFK